MTNHPFAREGRTNFHHYEQWETVGFTPLADFVCVYKDADRTHGYATEDCLGVLLQESTEATWLWDEEDGPGYEGTRQHERITRVVFAIEYDGRNGTVVSVDDVLGDNQYVRTMPRSAFQRWMAELDTEKMAAGNGR